jgi:DNA-directed RNA polymerase subunit alpha
LLEQLSLPRIEKVAYSETHGRYEIEPLEEGYGVTLGYALRRILLSSLSGAAITAVRLDGINHEFSDIPHVREDVTEFILNLKKVRLKYAGEEPIQVEIDVAGARDVTAGDITVPSQVEVVNPDQYLLHIDDDEASLHAELTVERGKGYAAIEQRENEELGTIPIDAIFAPIRRANYVIERTRVGPMTTYERLVLEIWTDGTIEPDEALNQSAQILTRHFKQIAEFSGHVPELEAPHTTSGHPQIPMHLYDTPIETLDLSPRAYNSLKRAGVGKVGEVLDMSEDELLNVRNFGRKSLDELRDRLILKNFITADRAREQFGGAFDEDADYDDDED